MASDLAELRAEAESLMTETCDIERQTSAWDEGAQETVTTWAPVHMDVPCNFVSPPSTSRDLLTGEIVTVDHPRVKVSVALTGIEPDDRITVASYGVVWVTHVPVRTNQVQRRLECRWVR